MSHKLYILAVHNAPFHTYREMTQVLIFFLMLPINKSIRGEKKKKSPMAGSPRRELTALEIKSIRGPPRSLCSNWVSQNVGSGESRGVDTEAPQLVPAVDSMANGLDNIPYFSFCKILYLMPDIQVVMKWGEIVLDPLAKPEASSQVAEGESFRSGSGIQTKAFRLRSPWDAK